MTCTHPPRLAVTIYYLRSTVASGWSGAPSSFTPVFVAVLECFTSFRVVLQSCSREFIESGKQGMCVLFPALLYLSLSLALGH